MVVFEFKKINLLVLGVELDTFEDVDRVVIMIVFCTLLVKYFNIVLLFILIE